MNHPPFQAPPLETMNGLLPAFEFQSLISAGELSAVYQTRQRSLERDVAIKILAPHVSENPGFRELFESTARLMAKLNHPNLIGVYDSGCVEGMLYFVMEFVPGKSLEHSASGQRIEWNQTLRLMEGICSGLVHAHGHGIIHGTLTPACILLNQKAQPKIGNFGFAHPSDAGSHTPFTAPEIAADGRAADIRSDVYSTGAILYQLVTGLPHAPEAAPPSRLADCRSELDAIWLRATHPDPGQRFPDVESLQAALKALASVPTAPITAPITSAQRAAVRPSPPESRRIGAAPHRPQAAQEGGFTWKTALHLCVIAGLIYATHLAYKNLEAKRAWVERQNQEALARSSANRDPRASKPPVPKPAQPTPQKNVGADDTPPTAEVPETPQESLARLREDLASGNRSEMPVGSVRKEECDYFLVSEPMSWPDAAGFAEQHGAHLAIPDSSADLPWLVENLAKGQEVWIGAARNGKNSWSLADGKAWQPRKEPSGIGIYLAADPRGFLRAERANILRPFLLQWHRDGSNPGALALLLASAAKQADPSRPVYPPGTRTYGVRNYLFIARPVSWPEAAKLAEQSGGHLAVATEISETVNLDDMTRELPAPDGIWLGGSLHNDHWQWITGEPWKTAKWSGENDSAAPDSALVIQPGVGWKPRASSEPASGFIIEWSGDRKSSSAASANSTPGPTPQGTETAALLARAKQLITAADQRRTEKLAANVKKLSWDLDVYLRGLNKGTQSTWSPHVESLKRTAKNNRIPSAIPRASGIDLSQEMSKLAQLHSEKQDQIDMEFMAEAEKIRSAFVAKLREARGMAQQSAQPKLAQTIGQSIDKAAKLDHWVRSLGAELQPANPVPPAASRRNSRNGPGGNPEPNDGIFVD